LIVRSSSVNVTTAALLVSTCVSPDDSGALVHVQPVLIAREHHAGCSGIGGATAGLVRLDVRRGVPEERERITVTLITTSQRAARDPAPCVCHGPRQIQTAVASS
jgi:hypothetical protein